MRCLIVGCGYTGIEFAALAVQNGCSVYAATRSPQKAQELRDRGISPIVYDWLNPKREPSLPEVDSLLISVSHAAVESVPPNETHVRGLRNLFASRTDWFEKAVYLSTTGVFASQGAGEWVDESSPTGPKRPGSIAALSAENWLNEHLPSSKRTILRLAGIYGPNRIPNIERLRNRLPMETDPNAYLNLVHVRDIASIVWQNMMKPDLSDLYCVSDGSPVLRRDYYSEICRWLGFPNPNWNSSTQASENLEGRIPKRGDDNKRISNRKLVKDLDYVFQFPSFRDGLRPLLEMKEKPS